MLYIINTMFSNTHLFCTSMASSATRDVGGKREERYILVRMSYFECKCIKRINVSFTFQKSGFPSCIR